MTILISHFLPVILLAAITTGDSYSKSTVINQVEGGEVYTRIEVEANGEKKVLESSESGKHEVEVKSLGSGSSEATVKSEVSTSSKIKNLWDNVLKMLSKIFRFGS